MNFIKRLLGLNKTKKFRPYGSSDEEIKQFFMDKGRVMISHESLTFENYLFEPSIVCKKKTFNSSDIIDINLHSAPPTLRIEDEIIFVSALKKQELEQFAITNDIPMIERPLIWSYILEPFLDTEFTDENKHQINKILAKYGLAENEVEQLREEVEEQMMKYNFDTMLWNWIDLNEYDVLLAMQAKYSKYEFKLFYEKVMQIALLDKMQK